MNGRLPVAIVARARAVAGRAGRGAVRTPQTTRHGAARDFAILYTSAHLYRAGTSFYDPGMDHVSGVNENPALVTEAARLGTLHAHEGYVHIHAFSYPPFTVLPFVPFTLLSWRHAVEAWLALSVVLLVAAFVWIARAARLGVAPTLTTAAPFLTSDPVENSLALGQIHTPAFAL